MTLFLIFISFFSHLPFQQIILADGTDITYVVAAAIVAIKVNQ